MPSIDSDLQMRTFKQGPHPRCAPSQSSSFQRPRADSTSTSLYSKSVTLRQWSLPERESRLHTPSEHPGKWQGQWDISAAPRTGSPRSRTQSQLKWKLLSCVQLFATPWTVACQAPLSRGFPRQEYWNGLPFPSPEDLPNPGIEPRSPELARQILLSAEPPGKPMLVYLMLQRTRNWALRINGIYFPTVYKEIIFVFKIA